MVSTKPRLNAFFRVYAATGSVPDACRAAGIAESTHYRRMKASKEYRERFNEIDNTEVVGVFEDELFKMALVGMPIVGKDGAVHHKKSLAAVLAVLRSKRPEKYRDSYKPEPSPPEDPDPRLDLLTKDELLQLEELLGKATHTVREANHALVGADQTGDVGAPQSGESVSE
jgi:hypothetical protein